jgi:glycosyltransferase involved in cell wall biosynthesis
MTTARGGAPDIRTSLWRMIVRGALRAYLFALGAADRMGPAFHHTADGHHVLLTGTFHSDNWITAHLGPLAASRSCRRVTMVATEPVPALAKVVGVYPPRWLRRCIGDTPARLLTFGVVAIRTRPDAVGGFHLLVNGLVAALVARLVGARSWYFCVGGITELRDGGVWGENRYFSGLRTPDPTVERQLLQAVASFDLVVTMGRGAIGEFRRRGVTEPHFEIIPGGIADRDATHPVGVREFDVILVARLVSIKRIELFIDAIAALRAMRPGTRATIVGDGPLRAALADHASQRGVADAITFAGHQDDVRSWLRCSRVFVLTSRSEGLALSMIEAMMEGLPAVVPNVGDLGDLVENGRNGYLVDDPTPQSFAAHVAQVLRDERTYRDFAMSARAAALAFSVAAATAKWDALLLGTSGGGEAATTGDRTRA